ncbi:hypothetical protein JXA63_04790 [Candidatus Woesebacteria bacterium]|nr:hypothetical protein [Candidatus Woesebacteria bacterium]
MSASISPSPSPELTGSMYVDKLGDDNKPLRGIKIYLVKDGAVIKTGFTPVLFEDLLRGTYIVTEDVPEGYEPTGSTKYEFTVVDEHLFHNYTFAPFFIPEPEFRRNQKVVKAANSGNLYPGASRKTIPSWNVFGRPKKPKVGMIGFNTQTKEIEIWNGTIWYKLPMKKIT